MERLALIAGYAVVSFVCIMGLLAVWSVIIGKLDLSDLISEDNGKASMARFQLLIFTFVLAMCLLVLTLESGEFPHLDGEILGLLGISGGSFVISKGIQKAAEKPKADERQPNG